MHKYDLEERTTCFAQNVIKLVKLLIKDIVSEILIRQLIRSATSIGANYREANSASSKKDFRNRIFLCKREAQETLHWLRITASYFKDREGEIKFLIAECTELVLIFGKILSTLKRKS